jgi:hypothetical protein
MSIFQNTEIEFLLIEVPLIEITRKIYKKWCGEDTKGVNVLRAIDVTYIF